MIFPDDVLDKVIALFALSEKAFSEGLESLVTHTGRMTHLANEAGFPCPQSDCGHHFLRAAKIQDDVRQILVSVKAENPARIILPRFTG